MTTQGVLMGPKYVIDSNVIIEGQNDTYPSHVFPTLWERIEALIADHQLYIPKRVIDEVTNIYDDEPSTWVARQSSNLYKPSGVDLLNIKEYVTKLSKKYPKMYVNRNNEIIADLYVIAIAKIYDATVITQEQSNKKKRNKKDKIKKEEDKKRGNRIPTVCYKEKVKCINLLGFIEEKRWIFK